MMNRSLKKMTLQLMIMAVAVFGIASTTNAQSIVGKWKRSAVVLTDADGVVSNVQEQVEAEMPCTASIVYEFTANGLLKTIIPAECLKKMSAMAKLYVDVKYSLVGNKLTVQAAEMLDFPDSVYLVKIQGGTMTWEFNYANNPKYPNPTKTKHMSIVYKKV